MKVPTVFGVSWKEATSTEFLLVFFIILLIVVGFVILKYLQILKDKKLHSQQLFLFKVKRLGLSTFQIKILNNLVTFLKLSNPLIILKEDDYFLKAIGKFLNFIRTTEGDNESFSSIINDIVIIYEKIYHSSDFKKPIESAKEISKGQLLAISPKNNIFFLGKVKDVDVNGILIHLLGLFKDYKKITISSDINVLFPRIGDAQYSFKSKIKNIAGKEVLISLPDELKKEKEFRHPYLDVILQGEIKKTENDPETVAEKIQCTVYKINDYEAVIRIPQKLEFNIPYQLSFELWDFNFVITAKSISKKTIEEENIFYYTLKFLEMSKPAKTVLKKYLYEHL